MRRWIGLLALLLGWPGVAGAQTYLVVVTGLSGEPAYAKAFHEWATTLTGAAEARLGVPRANVYTLAETADAATQTERATKPNLERVLRDVVAKAESNAVVWVILIGHGSADNGPARFNLPGPDVAATEFAGWLTAFTTQRLVVINAASASSDWIPALSGARRVVMTATRSPAESYATEFPRFLAAAFADDGADTDKDGRLSALEVFDYARRQTAGLYETAHRLATEHALLDDNGDGKGSETPSATQGDGSAAALVYLNPPRTVAGAPTDSALRGLYATRDSLQQLIADLRARKGMTDSTAYRAELDRLLLDLARAGQAIRARGGKE